MDKLHGSPSFYALLAEMRETHDKKSHDYAEDSNPYGNYEFAGSVAGLFAHSSDDAGFAGRLAEKIFRLSVLGKRQAEPRNESVADTERDIAVISCLWMASRRDKITFKQPGIPLEYRLKRQMQEDFLNYKETTPIDTQFQSELFNKVTTLIELMNAQTRKEIHEYLIATRPLATDSSSSKGSATG
jgi:hypothetical protein